MIPLAPYLIEDVSSLLTPALAIYPEIVDRNIAVTIRLLSGDPNRWRPHVKTAKLRFIMHRMAQHGIVQAKCSTTAELWTACAAGMKDVLLAYPMVGAGACRVRELAEEYPRVRISVLAEDPEQVKLWKGSRIGIFIDVNPGMDRTGIEQDRLPAILEMVHSIANAGLEFRGLHYYDGHLASPLFAERERMVHAGYDSLMKIVCAIEGAGSPIEEVITSGTPAFPCAATYAPFRQSGFVHRASPGTVIYSDVTSLSQLPAEWGYQPAALVVSTVVSQPRANVVTCDAGHKAVSADAGVPTCAVAGHPDFTPLKPSEEHLPIEVKSGTRPAIGETLYLIPRHVCPTVNNFDHAVIVEQNRIAGLERVTARGHEAPVRNVAVSGSSR
ncbi:MAG: D-TA family PLP-dependent enzyme [Acidobacteriia bacterium]|nr:D-TA family PLP-dependent enzyme [Terriglobia bacterium]